MSGYFADAVKLCTLKNNQKQYIIELGEAYQINEQFDKAE
jgi:hypothetical protein